MTITAFKLKDVTFLVTQAVAKDAARPELALLRQTIDSIKLLGGGDEQAKKAKLTAGAEQVKKDLRLIDAAADMFIIEKGVKDGATVTFAQIQPFLKTQGARPDLVAGKDPLGNNYPETYIAGQTPLVPATTAAALGAVADEAFWKPFKVEPHKKPAAKPAAK